MGFKQPGLYPVHKTAVSAEATLMPVKIQVVDDGLLICNASVLLCFESTHFPTFQRSRTLNRY